MKEIIFFELKQNLSKNKICSCVNELESTVQITFKRQFYCKKDYNWSYLLFKTNCYLHTPHTIFYFNKNMPHYIRFHVNCYLKATCNIQIFLLEIMILNN